MDIYTPSLARGFNWRPNCWTRASHNVPREECCTLCTMKEAGLAVMSICSYAAAAPVPATPWTFWEVMQEWGCTWLWEDMQLVGSSDWLANSIAEGQCIGVTDGL